jgi:gluconate 2-dehydrogenase
MKSTAFLINASRGQVVDQDALVEALRNNVIAGAGTSKTSLFESLSIFIMLLLYVCVG